MTPLEPLPAEEEFSPLAALESSAEILGFVWKQEGKQCLRELLGELLSNNIMFREELKKSAITLVEVGLGAAARIVAEYVDDAPLEESSCPYPQGSDNAAYWLTSFKRRQRRREIA